MVDVQADRKSQNCPQFAHRILVPLMAEQSAYLLLVVIFFLLQYCTPCSGSDYYNYLYNPYFSNYNPIQWMNPAQSSMNNLYQQTSPQHDYNLRNRKRFLGDQLETLTPSGSYSSDQQAHQTGSLPTVPINGWTSTIIDSIFGNSHNSQNSQDQQDSLNVHIKNILVPRVSGTSGNVQVRQYIVNSLKANNFKVDLDEFTGSTPYGNVNFANIVATSNPNACRQLVFACHYDSKLMDGFLGATDSAVPCAMLLKMSEKFSNSFRQTSGETPDRSLGLRFIFFDGEEAFVHWTSSDSLYGSRHLAEKWHKQPAPPQCSANKFKNELSRIELFVLLDLIGASDSSFIMYNRRLKAHYDNLQKYERQYFRDRGFSSTQIRRETAFKTGFLSLDLIQDDHVPFKQRGVPILSLLAHPFPSVWHTTDDNYNAIDFPKTRRIQYVLEEFLANYKGSEDN